MVVFTASLDYGFRLPLPELFKDFLNSYNCSATQLAPNSWHFMVGYVMACEFAGVEMNARHMYCAVLMSCILYSFI